MAKEAVLAATSTVQQSSLVRCAVARCYFLQSFLSEDFGHCPQKGKHNQPETRH